MPNKSHRNGRFGVPEYAHVQALRQPRRYFKQREVHASLRVEGPNMNVKHNRTGFTTAPEQIIRVFAEEHTFAPFRWLMSWYISTAIFAAHISRRLSDAPVVARKYAQLPTRWEFKWNCISQFLPHWLGRDAGIRNGRKNMHFAQPMQINRRQALWNFRHRTQWRIYADGIPMPMTTRRFSLCGHHNVTGESKEMVIARYQH